MKLAIFITTFSLVIGNETPTHSPIGNRFIRNISSNNLEKYQINSLEELKKLIEKIDQNPSIYFLKNYKPKYSDVLEYKIKFFDNCLIEKQEENEKKEIVDYLLSTKKYAQEALARMKDKTYRTDMEKLPELIKIVELPDILPNKEALTAKRPSINDIVTMIEFSNTAYLPQPRGTSLPPIKDNELKQPLIFLLHRYDKTV